MAGLSEAVLALVGLVTILVIGWQWLLERAAGASQPEDALRSISRAAHETHVRMAEEELRRQAAEWGRSNTLPSEASQRRP
jgi:hypothetical protein